MKEVIELLGTNNYHYVLSASQAESLNVIFTDLTPEIAGDYLVETDVAQRIVAIPVTIVGPEGIPLSSDFLDRIKDNGQGIILVEAKDENATKLSLQVTDIDGHEIFSCTLPLSISGVEEMFTRVDLRPVLPLQKGGTPSIEAPTNIPDIGLQNDKHFFFIHGFNVNSAQARGWLSEIYKRMYWSGSLAQFHGVTWQGDDGQTTWPILGSKTPDYHVNVVHALDTASHFATVINSIGPNVTLAAHSLGNMVSAAAIALHGANVDNFFMIDAAVAIEAFDGSSVQSIDMVHPEWDEYDERLWSSEWHNLFSTSEGFKDDFRHKLTWRNYFADAINNAYNFYSEGEEVLETHDHNDHPGLLDVGIFSGQYAWAMQEKLKGRTWINAGGSTYGGWGFNSVWDLIIDEEPEGPPLSEHISPDQAALLTNAQLRTAPFYRPGGNETKDLYVPKIGSDTTDSGSDFAQKNIRSLLAGYIPARTLSVGANEVTKLDAFGGTRNIHMQAELQNGWPQARIDGKWKKRWLHSDLKEISNIYIYPLFDKFVEDGGLQ